MKNKTKKHSNHTTQPPKRKTTTKRKTTNQNQRNEQLPSEIAKRKPIQLSGANLMSNVPWGDTLDLEKPAGTFRLYGMNPNGFRLDKKGGDITEFFQMAESIDADFVGCSEHNLDFTQFRVQDTANKAIRNTVEHSKAVWSTTQTPFDSVYKPGGTVGWVIGIGVARGKSTGGDDLGR